MDDDSFGIWEQELAHWGEKLDALRSAWVEDFLPVFENTLAGLLPLSGLRMRYSPGWDRKRSLLDVLRQGRDADRQMGFTQQGPQRADLGIRLERRPAIEVLSRGQQKLVVSALKLAQGALLESRTGRTCLYLIDDLPAELDREHRRVFCEWLEEMRCQVFITSVDHDALAELWQTSGSVSMFHMEHSAAGEGRMMPLTG